MRLDHGSGLYYLIASILNTYARVTHGQCITIRYESPRGAAYVSHRVRMARDTIRNYVF